MRSILLVSLVCMFFSLTATAQKDAVSQEKVYTSVQHVPSFPGGIEAFYNFLAKNIVYPKTARDKNTQGKVIVTYIVEKDGRLTDVKVARGIGDGCDEEAVRVIKLSSPWKPGTQNGHTVRVAYAVPINFALSR
ncbi:energy transducer TonB [Mucilaginibacter sp. L3T2-6]|uniref:energy transducer TonB n=1 Tax=Mucilaginibacter sp. L3T2-6 TaxID=3062491 RepID=UPI00267556CA|nr:energy transducer TonB [Mucilaginibacter sp. L3T2-6]MDO3641187.1 energy transducer TonB [Mucilaginibacter sp. L3T2-6]MDV6213337.1 energy transducer TonB [Mucilaginibacter sp. L3T2-6]